jgi:hypothetical protein
MSNGLRRNSLFASLLIGCAILRGFCSAGTDDSTISAPKETAPANKGLTGQIDKIRLLPPLPKAD